MLLQGNEMAAADAPWICRCAVKSTLDSNRHTKISALATPLLSQRNIHLRCSAIVLECRRADGPGREGSAVRSHREAALRKASSQLLSESFGEHAVLAVTHFGAMLTLPLCLNPKRKAWRSSGSSRSPWISIEIFGLAVVKSIAGHSKFVL